MSVSGYTAVNFGKSVLFCLNRREALFTPGRSMRCSAVEVTSLGFVCFVVINPCVLSANRVDFGLFFVSSVFQFYSPDRLNKNPQKDPRRHPFSEDNLRRRRFIFRDSKRGASLWRSEGPIPISLIPYPLSLTHPHVEGKRQSPPSRLSRVPGQSWGKG